MVVPSHFSGNEGGFSGLLQFAQMPPLQADKVYQREWGASLPPSRQHNPYPTPEEQLQQQLELAQRQDFGLQQRAEAEEKFPKINQRISGYLESHLSEIISTREKIIEQELTDREKLFLKVVTIFEFLKHILFFIGTEKSIVTFMFVKEGVTYKFANSVFEEIKGNNFLISKICIQMLILYRHHFSEYLQKYSSTDPHLEFQKKGFNDYILLIYHLFHVYEKLFSQNSEEYSRSRQYLFSCYQFIANAFNGQRYLKYAQVQYAFDQLICYLLKFQNFQIQYPNGVSIEPLQMTASIQRKLEANISQWNGNVIDTLVFFKQDKDIPPYLHFESLIGKAFCTEIITEISRVEPKNLQVWGTCCIFHCRAFLTKTFPLLMNSIEEKRKLTSQHLSAEELSKKRICLDNRIRFILAQSFHYLTCMRYVFNGHISFEGSTQLVESFSDILIKCVHFYQLFFSDRLGPSDCNYQHMHKQAFIILKFLMHTFEFIKKAANRDVYIFLVKSTEPAWDLSQDSQGCPEPLERKIAQKMEEHKQELMRQPETAKEKEDKMLAFLEGMIQTEKEEKEVGSPQRASIARRSRRAKASNARAVVEAPQERSLTLTQEFERKCEEIQPESWENKRRHLLEFWKTAKPQKGNEYVTLHSKLILQISQWDQLHIAKEWGKFEKNDSLDWPTLLQKKDKIFFLYKRLSSFLKQELEIHQQAILDTMNEIPKKTLKEYNLYLQENSQEIDAKYQNFCVRTDLLTLFQKMQESYKITWDRLISHFDQLQMSQKGIFENVQTYSLKLQETLKFYQQCKEEILKSTIGQTQPVQEAFEEMKDKVLQVKQAAERASQRSREQRDEHFRAQPPQRASHLNSSGASEFTRARRELNELSKYVQLALQQPTAFSVLSGEGHSSLNLSEMDLFCSLNEEYTIPANIIEAMEFFSQKGAEEKRLFWVEFRKKRKQEEKAFGDASFDLIHEYWSQKMDESYLETLKIE